MKINNRTLTKSALSGSILILLLWLLLGTTTTVTWFTDTDDAVNSFVYGNVDINVEYWDNSEAQWKDVSGSTKLFNSQTLYEPGYTQVVRLKISNDGDVPLDYRLAVNVNDYTTAFNYYNEPFCIPDYLNFGVIIADSHEELLAKTSERTLAQRIASKEMKQYKMNSYAAVDEEDADRKSGTLQAHQEQYAALVVTMPTDVGNEANYRGDIEPNVELGITVLASQLNTIQNIN